jgi:hypothetical protein
MAFSTYAAASNMVMQNLCFSDVQNPWSITTASQSDFKNAKGLPATRNKDVQGQFYGSASDMAISNTHLNKQSKNKATTCVDWFAVSKGTASPCFTWPSNYIGMWVKKAEWQYPPLLDCPEKVGDACENDGKNKNIDVRRDTTKHSSVNVCHMTMSGEFKGFTGMDCVGSTVCQKNMKSKVPLLACKTVYGAKQPPSAKCKLATTCSMSLPSKYKCSFIKRDK